MGKIKYAKYCLAAALKNARAQVIRFKEFPTQNAVHRVRVALRRTRTLIHAYRLFLNVSTSSAEISFRRLNRFLGEARDCYTSMILLNRAIGKPLSSGRILSLGRTLERRQQKALSVARRSIPRFFAAERALSKKLDRPSESSTSSRSYEKWLRKRLLKRLKRMTEAIDQVKNPSSPALHRARIELKKIRYLAETFERHPKRKHRLIKLTKKAQEKLGDIHDLNWLVCQLPPHTRETLYLRGSIIKESKHLYASYEKKLHPLPLKLKRRVAVIA